MSTTLFDKVWDSHVVRKIEDGPDVFLLIAISFMKLVLLLLGLKKEASRFYTQSVLPLPITTHQL
jgi:hypothetical protein